MRASILCVAIVAAASLIGGCSMFGGKAAPEPEFEIVAVDTPFEVRDYPELTLARTDMRDGSNPAFRRLFDYISGANAGEQRIDMTAPVLRIDDGRKIAMTAPVLRAEGGASMAFVLTPEFSASSAPMPADPAVEISALPARRVAVVTFNGLAGDEAIAEETKRLLSWTADRGLEAVGPAEVAQYNPPWTIPALRRNEIVLPIRRARIGRIPPDARSGT